VVASIVGLGRRSMEEAAQDAETVTGVSTTATSGGEPHAAPLALPASTTSPSVLAAPVVSVDVPPPPANESIATRLRGAGYRENDAGQFVVANRGGVGLAFNPNKSTPAMGVARCVAAFTRCIAFRGGDRCFSDVPVCDVADAGAQHANCCKQECLDVFWNARRAGDEPAAAADKMITSGCGFP
jgi:hypothetical protein